MVKYDMKTVLDYISGNDIEGYELEDLENDYRFMIQVIEYTNDKKMYNLCSEEVKNNYEFVIYMVNKFKNDIDFICMVADHYLNNVNESDFLNETELLITMYELTKGKNNEYASNCKLSCEVNFTAKRMEIEMIRAQFRDDEEVTREIQMGFWFIIDDYESSEKVLKYYAKKFVETIMSDNNMNIEVLLHEKFDTVEDLDNYGITKFLIEFIESYDTHLAYYISCNLDVLNEIKEAIEKAKTRWNIYISRDEAKKYNTLFNAVHEYMEENKYEVSYEETEILYFIGRELGINEKIAKYDYTYAYYNEDPQELMIDKSQMSLNDFRHYKELKRMIISILSTGKVNEKDDDSRDPGSKPKVPTTPETKSNNLALTKSKQRNNIIKINFKKEE